MGVIALLALTQTVIAAVGQHWNRAAMSALASAAWLGLVLALSSPEEADRPHNDRAAMRPAAAAAVLVVASEVYAFSASTVGGALYGQLYAFFFGWLLARAIRRLRRPAVPGVMDHD